MINIDTQRLEYILDHTPADQNILLVGRHGIGKSQILTQYFTTRGMRVVTLFLGQMSDPGDLIGLPRPATSRDGQIEQTVFAPPYWFPTDGTPIVLFLDELNRARTEILQTIMDLTLNRKLANHQLPKGSRIIAAVNDGEEYQLTQLDPALVSRFNVYQFSPTAQEWLLWATKAGVDKRVVAFIEQEKTWLDGNPNDTNEGVDTGLERYPDRRAWHRVSDLIKGIAELGDFDLDMLVGVVGAAAASRFYAFVQGRHQLSGEQVLNDFAACEQTLRGYRLHQMAIVNESLFRRLCMGLTQEQAIRYASNLSAYFAFLQSTEQREVIAHMANLFTSGSYEEAVLFISNSCPEMLSAMAEFIAGM